MSAVNAHYFSQFSSLTFFFPFRFLSSRVDVEKLAREVLIILNGVV